MCQLTYLDQAKFYMDPIFGFVAIDLGECKHFHSVGNSIALNAIDVTVRGTKRKDNCFTSLEGIYRHFLAVFFGSIGFMDLSVS